ncbi:MAG: hypothetical protein MJ247_02430 [Alphaproteobacteria bacterium]|nr:hypothetical protein [Alphaproteobacteria bacterium]
MKKPPIKPPSREDILLFQGFQRAIVEQRAFVKIDFKRLNKVGSPFFNPWENFLPLFVLLILAIATMYIVNLTMGTLVMTLFMLGYALFMPMFLEPFMTNRLIHAVVPKIEKFLIAWRYGGWTIYLTADPRYNCVAGKERWQEFIQSYFPDLIPVDELIQPEVNSKEKEPEEEKNEQ